LRQEPTEPQIAGAGTKASHVQAPAKVPVARPGVLRPDGAVAWRAVRSGIDDLWREVADDAEGATFFHTPTWAELCAATFGAWRAAPVAVEFSDGNRALLPFMRRASLLPGAGHHESMLPGVYGGPLFLAPPARAHWQACWDVVDEFNDVFLYGNPFLKWEGQAAGEHVLETTRALDLAPGYDEVLRRFRYSYRSGIRAARKRGLEVVVSDRPEDVDAYDRLYRSSLRRWGNKARGFYPRRLFHNLLEAGRHSPIRLWLVKDEGRIVGGAWALYHGEHVDYWHAAVDSNAMIHYPMHLLVATAVEDACAQGYRWFDFNPSGGLEGVELFKRGFHADVLEFSVVSRFGAAANTYRTYRRVLEKRLGRCPL
jgi:CelD/BcsL family acetyltransferase involved in cellulose biosynthesis